MGKPEKQLLARGGRGGRRANPLGKSRPGGPSPQAKLDRGPGCQARQARARHTNLPFRFAEDANLHVSIPSFLANLCTRFFFKPVLRS